MYRIKLKILNQKKPQTHNNIPLEHTNVQILVCQFTEKKLKMTLQV